MFFVRQILTCLTEKTDISLRDFVSNVTAIQLGEAEVQAVFIIKLNCLNDSGIESDRS